MDPKRYPEWQANLLKLLVSTTRAASAVGSHDISFERSIDSDFDASLTAVTDRLLNLSNRLLKFAGFDEDEYEDEDDLENRWGDVVDVVDTLLERADTCVDEFSGATSKSTETTTPSITRITKTGKGREKLEYNIFHANIARPQLKFKTAPDNVEGSPWRPLLKEKPHAMIPIEESLPLDESGEESVQPRNPYEYEIIHSTYPPSIFNVDGESISPVPLESTDVIWVDNITTFKAMLEKLKQATEVAVDLEHHDYRSYHGFVCLMQISTRKQDWIVDTLELREELIALNEVFTNPNIIKVFHGATSDVIWLQRDFGLYLVSLFDTYYAANALQFPSKSLAYLLLKYVNIEADKKYQLADWRIRPLPKEMLAYARSDTHYLLYIYDQLRRDLSARSKDTNRDLITDVLDSSRKIAMLSYVRERYDYEEGSGTDGWRKLLLNNKGPRLHSNLQLTVFKRVHQWRDQIAREEDESVNYVLPNRSLMNLAASLPHSMQAVVAACHPVPPLVQVYAEDIAYIVQRTRKELVEEAAKAEATAAEAITGTVDSQHKNGVTGATHVWYKDETTAPNGVRSVMEAVRHGAQFDVWGEQKDRLHTLLMSTSKFWEPLHREYKVRDPIHEIGGELEDVKLSVPLPPLTAQIYMTAEDIKAMDTPEVKGDNVASLAEHPFVQKSREEANQQKGGPEIIIARQLGKKEKKREREVDTDVELVNGDSLPPAEEQPIRSKSKSKRRKGLKEKMDAAPTNKPVVQFDPYKIEDSQRNSEEGRKNRGPSSGKSMTFFAQKG